MGLTESHGTEGTDMNTLRMSSTYAIDMYGADASLLDLVISRLPVQLEGSALRSDKAYVLFRASNDSEASQIAMEVMEDEAHVLRTGLGAHLRIVYRLKEGQHYDEENAGLTEETPTMLARAKWQIKTIAVLEKVFQERISQFEKHGDAMLHLSDGIGPELPWLEPLNSNTAAEVQVWFREDYEKHRGSENPDGQYGELTRMHLVREEIAEAFEMHGDDPRFLEEIIQVAALCVQWAEYKLDEI